jgi:hypothetical protein
MHLGQSKTDPCGDVVDVRVGANASEHCPVNLLREATEGAPLQGDNDPLFENDNGSPITYRQLVQAVKGLAALCGINTATVAGHSLRIVGATSLALLGFEAHDIRTLGRREPLSYQLYVRAAPHLAAKASKALAAAPSESRGGYFGGMPLDAARNLSTDNFDVVFNYAR